MTPLPDERNEAMLDLIVYCCGPKRCEHVYDKEETIIEDSLVRGATLVCSKCGTRAIDNAMWVDP